MAQLLPDLPHVFTAGQGREQEMLRLLEQRLPADFLIYHGLHWSTVHEGAQRFGELDAVVVSPGGHVVVLEIKSGDVELSGEGFFKQYGPTKKDVGHQARAQLHGLIGRLREDGLGMVKVCHFVLLADFRVVQAGVGYPRDRIIDATQLDEMHTLLIRSTAMEAPIEEDLRLRLCAFLGNRFQVAPDPSCRVGQRQALTRRLAAGLATWVPRIDAPEGAYLIEATAGSGKTQLALRLLSDASACRAKARYVCFNRPLADHIKQLAPAAADVGTVHEFAVEALRASGMEPDFSRPETFAIGIEALLHATKERAPWLDLLIIDESQDFEATWMQALLPSLRAEGRLYVLGDPDQAIYRKEPFDLPGAVRITCHDNFRSPRQLVDAINELALTDTGIEAMGPDVGEQPGIHHFTASDPGGLRCAAELVDQSVRAGHKVEDIAILTFRGRERSGLLELKQLGSHLLRRFTGRFDNRGEAIWTPGGLLAESIYRFKGQAAPIVIVCEIDFEEFDAATRSKLFVAMTRAQLKLHLVMSHRAIDQLAARSSAPAVD